MQLTSFDRTRGFLLTKTHDSMPGVNGSSMLASHRTTHFLSRGLWRQTFYEAVGRVETLLSLVAETEELGSLGLPTYMRDGYFLIFEVFESAYRAPAGDIQMPTASDRSLGLHAVHVTGQATGGGGLEFWNSWGAGWGRRGYGSVSEEYLAKYFYEGWVVRSGRWGPTEHKRVFLCESPDPRESVRAWQIQNPRQGEQCAQTLFSPQFEYESERIPSKLDVASSSLVSRSTDDVVARVVDPSVRLLGGSGVEERQDGEDSAMVFGAVWKSVTHHRHFHSSPVNLVQTVTSL